MAFARSASGPAGLSINTGAANTFGSSSTQPPAAGGLFGTPSASQPSTQTNSLFGNTAAPQQAQTTSLFGASSNTNTNQQQQQQQQGGGSLFGSSMASAAKPGGLFGASTTGTTGGGLFGNSTTTSQPQQQTGGGLFGQNAATSQPQQGGGLFGNSTTTSQQQQTGGGLFGQNAATSQPQQGGGLFGSAAASTSQPQQQTGGLFGASTQQPATTGGGLFGQQQQQQQKPAGSLFGGGATNTQAGGAGNTGSLFGQKSAPQTFGQSFATPPGGIFGGMNQPTGQQQPGGAPTLGSTMGPQVIPGVRIDVSNIRNTTRFNDLQEELQQRIADVDQLIQNCIGQKEQVDAFMPAHGKELNDIPGDVRFVQRKYAAVDSALGADLQAIKQLRDQVKVDTGEAKLSMTAVNNLQLPSQYHTTPGFFSGSTRQSGSGEGSGGDSTGDGSASPSDLVSYFSKATEEMDEQIKKLQNTVKEIQTHLGGVEHNITEQASRLQSSNGTMSGPQDDRVMELYTVLRDFEESILQVAGVVGGAREGVTELQLSDFRGRGLGGVH